MKKTYDSSHHCPLRCVVPRAIAPEMRPRSCCRGHNHTTGTTTSTSTTTAATTTTTTTTTTATSGELYFEEI